MNSKTRQIAKLSTIRKLLARELEDEYVRA